MDGLWVLLLYMGGLILIFAEIFLPGGILGAIGVAGVVASIVLTFMWLPEQAVMWVFLQFIGLVIVVILGIRFFPHSPVARWMTLKGSIDEDQEWVDTPTNQALLGAEGTVFTPLRPAGTILINGERVNAVSDGSLIEKDDRVRVIEVHGNRIVVEKVED
jgi:membrane-bound serine protease (ClpP class)